MFKLESEVTKSSVTKSYQEKMNVLCNELRQLTFKLTGNIETDQNILLKIRKKLFSLKNQCNSLISNNDDIELDDALFNVQIEEYSSNIYHYNIDCHLPCLDGKSAQDYFETFYKASLLYDKKYCFSKMNNAVVLIINYYEEDEFWIDCDNINYKPFIDACIKNFILPDDNSKYLQLMSFSKAGLSHTEAYVGSFDDILNIIKSQ